VVIFADPCILLDLTSSYPNARMMAAIILSENGKDGEITLADIAWCFATKAQNSVTSLDFTSEEWCAGIYRSRDRPVRRKRYVTPPL
jgi:hypothetical protein